LTRAHEMRQVEAPMIEGEVLPESDDDSPAPPKT